MSFFCCTSPVIPRYPYGNAYPFRQCHICKMIFENRGNFCQFYPNHRSHIMSDSLFVHKIPAWLTLWDLDWEELGVTWKVPLFGSNPLGWHETSLRFSLRYFPFRSTERILGVDAPESLWNSKPRAPSISSISQVGILISNRQGWSKLNEQSGHFPVSTACKWYPCRFIHLISGATNQMEGQYPDEGNPEI